MHLQLEVETHYRSAMPRFNRDSMHLRQCFSYETRQSKRGSTPEPKTSSSPVATGHSALPSHDGLPTARHDSAHPSISEHDESQSGDFESRKLHAGSPSRCLNAHHLPKHSIPASIDVDVVPLKLPDSPQPATTSETCRIDVQALSQAHFLAFQPPDASSSTKSSRWTIEAATKQVKILSKAFPLVGSSKALLSMCAWFHLFCFYDDETEKMPAKEARTVMKHCMHILEVACQTKGTSQRLTRFMGPLQRAKVQYTLWLSSRLPSGGKVAYATYLFVQQAQRLLGEASLRRVTTKMIEVFKGYYCETLCREHIEKISVQEYTHLRASTIGLSPFWAILRDTFFAEAETHLAETGTFALETHAAAVVGLQNDLVGLANDYANGDPMNYIILRANREGLSTAQALTAAIELHNETVSKAVEERRRVERSLPESWSGSGGMRLYADCMLGFMTTHFLWASSAGRYKPVS